MVYCAIAGIAQSIDVIFHTFSRSCCVDFGCREERQTGCRVGVVVLAPVAAGDPGCDGGLVGRSRLSCGHVRDRLWLGPCHIFGCFSARQMYAGTQRR